jgi:hypothetical protein
VDDLSETAGDPALLNPPDIAGLLGEELDHAPHDEQSAQSRCDVDACPEAVLLITVVGTYCRRRPPRRGASTEEAVERASP